MLVTTSECELEVDRGPNLLFVRVRISNDDIPEIPDLASRIWSLLEQHFTYRLVLELDEIKVLPSQLIGQLVLLQKRICTHDGVLRLSGLSAANREVLKSCRFGGRFPTYANRVEAVMGCCPQKPR